MFKHGVNFTLKSFWNTICRRLKALKVTIFPFSFWDTLRVTKTTISTPKCYDNHPRRVKYGSPPPWVLTFTICYWQYTPSTCSSILININFKTTINTKREIIPGNTSIIYKQEHPDLPSETFQNSVREGTFLEVWKLDQHSLTESIITPKNLFKKWPNQLTCIMFLYHHVR